MEAVNAGQLKRVIEAQHGGTSTYVKSMRVLRARSNATGWDGLVHVFDLKNHDKAKRAYAWMSPIAGGTKPRFFAVLHMGPVTGPVEAVKAASGAIRKWGPMGTKN
jgi:hypothetical protein